jgi:hypothetical protein
VDYGLLPTIAEGLSETEHPYYFVAKTAFKDMLTAQDAYYKTLPHVPRIVLCIRNALRHKDSGIFLAAIDALKLMSVLLGQIMNEHLKVLMGPLASKLTDKHFSEQICSVMSTLCENGGPPAVKYIKSKVPTFQWFG